MPSIATAPLTSTVTVDLPAVIATNETRALAILAKQKSRLNESAVLMVEKIFEYLEQQPPISESGTYQVTINNRSFEKHAGSHEEAARYGVSAYAGNEQSLRLLETAVRNELGSAFGTLKLSAYQGEIYVSFSVQKSDSTALTLSGKEAVSQALALTNASAITDKIASRRADIAERRDVFVTIAKSPSMQGVFALAKAQQGYGCALHMSDSIYLKPNGRLINGYGTKVNDETLLGIDLSRLATTVQNVIAGAQAATIPSVYPLPWHYAIFG